jgi:hypothetical protein
MHSDPDEVFDIEGITDGRVGSTMVRVFWEWTPLVPGVHVTRAKYDGKDLWDTQPVPEIRSALDTARGKRVTVTLGGQGIQIPHPYVELHQELVEEQIAKMAAGVPWSRDPEEDQ